MRSIIAAAVGVVVGIWMMFAPAVLGYSGSAATSDRIVGPVAAAAAWVAVVEVTRSLRWVNVPLGMWAALSPLVLHPPAAATIHSVLSGIVLVTSSLAIGPIPRERYGGGWKTLVNHERRE